VEAPPGYTILAPLAEGGMAEVFLAERRGPGGVAKVIALKRLAPALEADGESVAMFRREAKIALDLSHGRIVPVFDFQEGDAGYFLAMEYVRGWNVAKILGAAAAKRTPLPPALVAFVIEAVAEGLAYAHERTGDDGAPLGLVHRDVSPANVLVSIEGEVKIADFGIARAAALAPLTQGGSIKGKIPYMSPEQARGEPLDARSDLYSLGVIMFELSTARRYVRADSEAMLLDKVRRAERPEMNDVPPALAQVIAKATAARPEDRFVAARAMHAALLHAATAFPPVGSADLARYLATLDLPTPLDPRRLRGIPSDAKTPPTSSRGLEVPPPIASVRSLASASQLASAPASSALARPPVVSSATPNASANATTKAIQRALVAVVFLAAAIVGVSLHALVRPTTRLVVQSTTPNVIVVINGLAAGPAPIEVRGLGGKARVELIAPGFARASREVDLDADASVVVDVAIGR
jgi:serine/threonine-protein kinase